MSHDPLSIFPDVQGLIGAIRESTGRTHAEIVARLMADAARRAAHPVSSAVAPEASGRPARRRRDASLKPYDGRRTCPLCASATLYIEPICPGCADGRSGWRWRLHCGECSYTEMFKTRGEAWQSPT